MDPYVFNCHRSNRALQGLLRLLTEPCQDQRQYLFKPIATLSGYFKGWGVPCFCGYKIHAYYTKTGQAKVFGDREEEKSPSLLIAINNVVDFMWGGGKMN